MLGLLGLCILSVVSAASGSTSHRFRAQGPQAVNLWRLDKRLQPESAVVESNVLATSPPNVVQSTFTQPLDHFNNSLPFTFEQRYWVNAEFYQKGGPVILLDGGETSGADRLPYISTGIAAKLANATGGLCLVLEHRYYGDSIPVDNFSTDALRWLTNEQAVADSANFMSNTPWIYYGGSYAGARSAHMRILKPDLVYGAIASSGVTHASVELWQYFDVVRKAAPQNCSSVIVKAVESINIALSRADLNGPLKQLFGLTGLPDDDFASLLTSPMGAWQGNNWDPSVSSTGWFTFCETIAAKPSDPSQQTGHIGNLTVDYGLLNYANYSRTHFAARCLQQNMTIMECYSTTDDASFQVDDLSQDWRTWQYQVCTTWGFFIDAPPKDVPPIAAYPLTVPYLSKICRQAFPPGKISTVPKEPNVTSVNVLGGYHIAADRLAIIDGELDPWRPATPHSSYVDLPPRKDTIIRPFKLIPGAVHHWDENGLADGQLEPPTIQAIHKAEIDFVKAWLNDWKPPRT